MPRSKNQSAAIQMDISTRDAQDGSLFRSQTKASKERLRYSLMSDESMKAKSVQRHNVMSEKTRITIQSGLHCLVLRTLVLNLAYGSMMPLQITPGGRKSLIV